MTLRILQGGKLVEVKDDEPQKAPAKAPEPPAAPPAICDWAGTCRVTARYRLRLREQKLDFGHHKMMTRLVCGDHLGKASDASGWDIMGAEFIAAG